MDLPLSTEYIYHAIEQEKEKAAWELWSGLNPYMEMNRIKPLSFGEYKEKLFTVKPKASKKTSEEIMSEMMRVVSRHEGR
jgi:hypothetical protein